jgi:hypothetical protein
MQTDSPFIFSHSGQVIGPDYPAVSIEDMAVSLGRICRFAGHGLKFWPVLLHSFVVQDLVPEEAKGVALLHDGSESLVSDVPTPFKNAAFKEIENKILNNIFWQHLSGDQYRVWNTNPHIWKMVKIADGEAFDGEVWTVGTKALRGMYVERSPQAEKLVRKYLKKYSVDDCVRPDGLAVIDFIRRAKDYQ